jgi:hypothetical protein
VFSRLLFGLGLSLFVLSGCRELDDPSTLLRDAGADLAMPSDMAARDGSIAKDLASPDLSWPAPMPPPASCYQRSSGVTGIQVVLRVDQYIGVKTGRNGPHEIIHGTIVNTPWVYKSSIIDTTNIEVAMNIQTATDMTGLPKEIPVRAGEQIELEGEYIPKATANATTALGPAAVLHFTHEPCGYAVLGGVKYR